MIDHDELWDEYRKGPPLVSEPRPKRRLQGAKPMTDPKASILATERAKGYSEGVGQATMVCYDEAYHAGQCAAWRQAPSRLSWFLWGSVFTQAVWIAWEMLK